MKRRRFAVILALVWTSALLLASDKKKEPEQVSSVKFEVLKDDNGKPVRNAAVVLHPVANGGKQERGGFELKTDGNGKTEFDGIPYGPLRIQVIANGFQTFGDDFQINQPDQAIVIRLKRPRDQYTIYGDDAPKSDAPKDKKDTPQQ